MTTTNIEIDLIKEINAINKNENFVFSPIGIEIILSLISNGAEGETQNEILQLLNYSNIDEANITSKKILNELKQNKEIIKIANGILTRVRAKEKFIKKGIDDYDAKIEELKNYENINKWVKNQTNNNIIKIIDSLPDEVLMVLLNALYFEGFWEKQFDKNDSELKEFYNLGNKNQKINTTMMILHGTLLNYYENDYAEVVKLNYKNAKSFHGIIILPNENLDIDHFIKQFNNEMYEEIIEGLNNEETINLVLPQFEVEFKDDLSNIIKNSGIRKAFTNEAEFKGLCDKTPIHIGQILQKNYINVNEEGTQASSVTEVEFILECYKKLDPKFKTIIINRPFIFLLRDETLPKGRDILFFTKICKFEEDEDL